MKANTLRSLFLLATFTLSAVYAKADNLLFDLSPSNFNTNRGADEGVGQGVVVSTTTTIDAFSFFANMPSGGNAKLFVEDGSNSTVLFSDVVALSASGSGAWVTTDPLSFTLDAGSTYYFGIIGDNDLQVGFISPVVSYSANGLTASTDGNTNYNTFSSPSFEGPGGAEIALRLYETSVSTSPVPEPSSLVLAASGLLAGAGALRRRLLA